MPDLALPLFSALTVSRESDQKIFRTLKIQDAPIYRPLSILTNAQTNQTKDERPLSNLLRDHRLLLNILSKELSEVEGLE